MARIRGGRDTADGHAIMLKSPYPYYGGKSAVAPLIWQRLGDVPNLVIPFFGSGAELWARPHWDIAAGQFAGGSPYRIETVNDLDGMVANFNRALKHSPDEVAFWASDPVNETDLHARHSWLVNVAAPNIEPQLRADPDFYDSKAAGWWVWGISQWIGSGWCSRPDWTVRPALGNAGNGVLGAGVRTSQQLPLLKGEAGIHAKRTHQKRPHLMSSMGIFTQQPTAVTHKEHLRAYMGQLSQRLSRVRVCAGDWSRVLGPSPTYKLGLTGVILDPPYSAEAGRDNTLYAAESQTVAHDVRRWCLEDMTDERGGYAGPRYKHPLLRLVLCGYEGEHDMPADWECVAWKTNGGYGNQSEDNGNKHRERLWFSPNCLTMDTSRQMSLFDQPDLSVGREV